MHSATQEAIRKQLNVLVFNLLQNSFNKTEHVRLYYITWITFLNRHCPFPPLLKCQVLKIGTSFNTVEALVRVQNGRSSSFQQLVFFFKIIFKNFNYKIIYHILHSTRSMVGIIDDSYHTSSACSVMLVLSLGPTERTTVCMGLPWQVPSA